MFSFKKISSAALLLAMSFTAHATISYDNVYFFGDSLSAIGGLDNDGRPTDCNTNVLNSTASIDKPNTCLTWANYFYDNLKNAGKAGGYIPLQPNQGDTIDYAKGGAQTTALQDQLNHYFTDHGNLISDQNSLFIIWMGGNDFLNFSTYCLNDATCAQHLATVANELQTGTDITVPEKDLAQYIAADENNFFTTPNAQGQGAPLTNTLNAVKTLIQANAKNVLVFNMPDITKAPAARASGLPLLYDYCRKNTHFTVVDCQQFDYTVIMDINHVLQDYNKALADALAKQYPEVHLFDAYTVSEDIYHGKYGQMNVWQPCSGSKAQCSQNPLPMYWNAIHPSWATHSIIAKQALAFLGK